MLTDHGQWNFSLLINFIMDVRHKIIHYLLFLYRIEITEKWEIFFIFTKLYDLTWIWTTNLQIRSQPRNFFIEFCTCLLQTLQSSYWWHINYLFKFNNVQSELPIAFLTFKNNFYNSTSVWWVLGIYLDMFCLWEHRQERSNV